MASPFGDLVSASEICGARNMTITPISHSSMDTSSVAVHGMSSITERKSPRPIRNPSLCPSECSIQRRVLPEYQAVVLWGQDIESLVHTSHFVATTSQVNRNVHHDCQLKWVLANLVLAMEFSLVLVCSRSLYYRTEEALRGTTARYESE